MKNILYIGNNLNRATSNMSYINVLGSLLSKEGFEVSYASGQSNKLLRLLHMISRVVLLRNKVDIVLIDTYSTQNFYYAYGVSQFCRFFNLDYMPILHGGNLPSRLHKSPKMSRKIFKHAKYNIAPSKYLQNAFAEFGYDVIHIPNTIQIENYRFTDRAFDIPKLLWVRSFSKIYNPQLAIKIFYKLKEIYPEAELCMVGPDSDGTLDAVKKMSNDLNLDVVFTGKLDKKEWIERSKGYNVFLNTTNFDNMPLSVIEAMALGIPVVSTNVGGIPYLIKDHYDGYLVEPNNEKEMIGAICEVFDQPLERNKIIKNAREKVEQFDWKDIRHKWIDILDKNNVKKTH